MTEVGVVGCAVCLISFCWFQRGEAFSKLNSWFLFVWVFHVNPCIHLCCYIILF